MTAPAISRDAELAEKQVLAAFEGATPAVRRAMVGYCTVASRLPAFAAAWARLTRPQRYKLRHASPLADEWRAAEKAAR